MSALTSFESDLIAVGEKIKAGVEAAGQDAGKVLTFVTANSATITGLASIAGPSGATIASLGLKLIGLVGAAIEGAGSAASADGVSVTLDNTVKADVEAVIAAVKAL